MNNKKRYSFKSILIATLWVCVGAAATVLLVAGVHKKDTQRCSKVDINIKGAEKIFFIDENDVLKNITAVLGGEPLGKSTSSFNLRKLETELEKNIWVQNAELFFDNNNVLQVNVLEREPVARIFTASGATFYIDNSTLKLPLSEKFSARLPVFTGFPTDNIILSKEDSVLLQDVKLLSLAIQQDSFRMALAEQIDITAQRQFEIIPKIGNHIIVFGDAANAAEKFERLKLFYKNILPKAGLNYYSSINVQYKNQVVAKKRDAADFTADSLRTLQMMQLIAANAEKMASDSLLMLQQDNEKNTTDSTMIQQSIQRDEANTIFNTDEKPEPQEPSNKPVAAPKPVIQNPKPARPNVSKPNPVKPKPNQLKPNQPKATMPKRNDY